MEMATLNRRSGPLYRYRYRTTREADRVPGRLAGWPSGLPGDARREVGYQLDRVQRGLDPDDWRPMPSIGAGVREIRVRERAGAFRVIYAATFVDAVYVLHALQK